MTPIRYFQLNQLAEAMSYAEQGGIAVHLERRRAGSVRNVSIWPIAYRVLGTEEQLRGWAKAHAQWFNAAEQVVGEPELWYFIIVGETARRVEAELGIGASSSPQGAEV